MNHNLYFKNMTKDNKYLILLILSIIITLGITYFIVSPLSDQLAEKENEVKIINLKIAKVMTFSKKNQDYDKFLKLQKLKFNSIYEKIPQNINVMRVISEYKNLASFFNLNLETIKPGKEEHIDKKYFKIPFELKVVGNYYNLLLFLQDIEKKGKIIEIISPKFVGGKGDNVSLNATLLVYSLNGSTYD